MLLQLLIVLVEFTKLIWEDVGVWYEVEVLLSISFLHPDHVEAKSIFPCDLVALWEMIDFLVFIQAFIQVALATTGTPEDIPLMALGWSKAVVFKDRTDQLVIEP